MSTDTPSESITELLSYSQADEEGVIVKVSRQAIHEVVAENARLREELELIRAALTGDDYASLPSDLPTVRMAHTIRADHDKFRNQVRDTCHRAEQAEKELAEAKREVRLAKLVIQQKQNQIASAEIALEQAEARARELTDLRDILILCGEEECADVQGYPQKLRALIDGLIVVRRRALAAEKQLLTRLVDALESAVDWAGYASEYFREKHHHQLDIDKLDAARDELAAIDAAIAGAKHEG